jgi:hypothetical protein
VTNRALGFNEQIFFGADVIWYGDHLFLLEAGAAYLTILKKPVNISYSDIILTQILSFGKPYSNSHIDEV